jgi:tRNA(Ile)-lysidine synthase
LSLNEATLNEATLGAAGFAALMEQLGPFEPAPLVAVAVSGGADSMAAAWLVRGWARARGGDVLALVVDHGLRAASADEALVTIDRLSAIGIAAIRATLTDLARGPGLAERARAARHDALEAACAARGILHLVFGHHGLDQAETVVMRLLARSGPDGLAGIASVVETPRVRRLRPLLTTPPSLLRATLRVAGIAWVEDPSNADPSQQRARLRLARADPDGTGLATLALIQAAAARGAARLVREQADAEALARAVQVYPEGFAVLSDAVPASALAALLRMLGGACRPPAVARVAGLAAAPRASTMAGVRITPAGRLGPGWLLTREPAAMQPAIAARAGALWDGRFRVVNDADGTLGAWGDDAPRDRNGLPTAILRTLPAVRRAGRVVAGGSELWQGRAPLVRFAPRGWMTGAGFSGLPRYS